MTEDVTFGRWLRQRRRRLDLTQEGLATRVGYALPTIRRVEADDLRPSRELAEKLADALGLTPDERPVFVRFARGERDAYLPLPATVAPLPVPTSLPRHNLPAQPTPLIGREAEIQAVCDRLSGSGVRLLTLTGPGGVGKTRVVLQAAAQLLETAPDGVWFVPLAPIRDPHLVAPAIARELEMADSGDVPLAERLKRYLHPKQALLVLDNFEQVAEAAALVADLLAAAPDLKILITSREPLRVYGEHEYAVPPLALPDRPPATDRRPPRDDIRNTDYAIRTTDYASRITQYEAVRLFIERARAVKPDFRVTNDNAPAVAEICHRLDGLPLAIELAAARSRIFTPEALLARLEGDHHRLAFLTGGARNLPARHQTLRGAIAWSYDLLEPEEKTLFSRLAVFSGGFTLDAAEAVCAGRLLTTTISGENKEDGVLRELAEWSRNAPPYQAPLTAEDIPALLESLVSKSLVKVTGDEGRRTEDGGRTEDEGRKTDAKPSPPSTVHRLPPAMGGPPSTPDPRFMLLETVREYALERLVESGEEAATRWRHAGYYGWLVTKTDYWKHVRGVGWLEDELDNLRGVLGWCTETGEALPGLAISSSWHIWQERTNEGRRWLAAILARPLPVGYAVTSAWYSAGSLAMFNNDYPAARAAYENNYRMLERINSGSVFKLWHLGLITLGEGDIPGAGVILEKFLANERAHPTNGAVVAWGEYALGAYYITAGDLDKAQTHLEDCLAYSRAENRITVVVITLCFLGYAAHMQGDLRRGASFFRESIELAYPRRERKHIAWNLFGIASLALKVGDLKRAARLFGAAEALSEMTGGTGPENRHLVARTIAALRERLDAETLERHWAEGRRLDWEQAVDEALAFAAAVEARAASDMPEAETKTEPGQAT